jgi:hypothetical protein
VEESGREWKRVVKVESWKQAVDCRRRIYSLDQTLIGKRAKGYLITKNQWDIFEYYL